MASFSFSAGNTAKLLRLPLYAAGRIATTLIPRTADDWVFGSAAGVADGALQLWRRAAGGHRRMVWLTASPQERRDAAELGIPTVAKGSLRGFWQTARARVVVVTHGFGDVNRYAVPGAFIVQLWHGIPLKRIGVDSPETVRLPRAWRAAPGRRLAHALLTAAYRATTRRIRVIPAASHTVRARLESAFSLPDTCVPVTGEPRTDVLFHGSAAQRRDAARRHVEAATGPVGATTRLVLYAPTWRDGDPDPAIPDADAWRLLGDVLERNDAILLIRSHPLGAGRYAPSSSSVRLLGADVAPDIMPLLPGLDALVTDYSSIAFDAALVPVPTIFFAPDLEAYTARRGLYGTYRDVAGPDWVVDWAGVADRLAALLTSADARTLLCERARALSARVHAYADGHSTDRVYDAILSRIGPHGAAAPGNGGMS